MSNDISICVPKVMATPAEFAEWEGRSRGSVYQMIHNGKLAKFLERKENRKTEYVYVTLSTKRNKSGKTWANPISTLMSSLVTKFNYENFLRGQHV